jgi:hypothetical protein
MNHTILALIAVTGCASNAYRDYYVDTLGGKPATADPRVIASTEPPLVYRGTTVRADARRMLEDGYLPIGASQFNSGEMTAADSERLAREVATQRRAAVVLLYSDFDETVTEPVDRVIDDPTVTTWTRVDRWGREHARSRTVDNYTTVTEDVAVDRYDYAATYWVKARPTPLGAFILDLTPAQRQSLQRNGGVTVFDVVNGSPAFAGGVMAGDVLLRVDHADITDRRGLQQVTLSRAGQTIELEALRAGVPVQLHVRLATLDR